MGIRTIRLTIYSLSLVVLLFSCWYGGQAIVKKKYGKYYFYIYLSVISMTLGRMFILVYSYALGNTDGFSLGSLGIISAYLFISAANKELQDKVPLQISAGKEKLAQLGSLLMIFLLAMVCLFGKLSFNEMLPPILLMITSGYSFYSSLRIILAGKAGNDVYPYLVSFHCLVCFAFINSVLTEMTWLIETESVRLMMNTIIGITNIIWFVLMLPVLERGLNKWKM